MFQKINKKFKNITKNDILKSFFILLTAVLLLFLFINYSYIEFAYNGFSQLAEKDLQVYYLNVGQASANVVIFPNKSSMIIDTGSQDSEEDFLQAVDNIFNSNKIKTVDFLVLTHSDEDHIGGAEAVLEKYQVNTIFRPQLLTTTEQSQFDFKVVDTQIYENVISMAYKEPNCEVMFTQNIVLNVGGEVFVRFWANKLTSIVDTNYYSPFITIDYADKTYLFTGDATKSREEEFVEQLNENNLELEVNFLNVAHHGSKYSSNLDFLQTINPKIAIVSAGDSNHPHQEVINRLKDVGTFDIYCTKEDGMIAIGLSANGNYTILNESKYLDLPFICILIATCLFIALQLGFDIKKRGYYQDKFVKTIKIHFNN